jgi:PAS domain S-box-containing protein
MAALLVAASLLPLSVWAYLDLRADQVRLLNGVKDVLEARGDQIVHELDSFHRSYQRSVNRMALYPDSASYCAETPARRAAHHAAMLGILAAYPASDTGIRGAGLIDGSGHVVIATEPALIGMDASDRPITRAAMQGRTVISDPFVSFARAGSVPTIAYLAPMFDADRHVVCVAVLWVRATALWSTVKASNALAGPDSFAVIFDRQGIRIAHTYSDEIVFHPGGVLDPATVDRLVAERRFGERTRALLEDVRAFPEQFERARSTSPDLGVFRGFAPVNQTWNYGVARRFETVPWTVFYMVPETAVTAQIAQATRERVLRAAGVIAFAGIVGLAFAAGILRPVRALGRAVQSIADGDLSARVHDLRGDELGRFGGSFNAMAEHIQEQDAALRQSRDRLDQQVQVRTAELTQTTLDLQAEIVERMHIENVLRERDAALHRAHVMTKLAHVITRPDGSFETWSETLPPLIGVEPAQMPQSTREWMGLLHPDDRSTFRSTSIAAGVAGTPKDVEYRLRRADGTWIHVHQVIEPIPGSVDVAGKMRWFSTLRDITEQKHAEEALRASEERTRMIVDTALDAVVTMDSSGLITGWSPQAETTFGWSRAEALGQSLAQTIIPPRHREDHRRGFERYLATGEAVVLNKRVELTALHRDGREFPIDLSITPIRTKDSIGFSAFVRDITDRKRIEEVRMRLAAIVESSDDSIISKNLEGIITSWNPAAEMLFGYSAAEAIGRSVQMLVPPERGGEEPDILARIGRGETVDHFETVRVRKDGSRVDVSATISPIRNAEGRVIGASKIARNIADRKLAQARLQAQLDRLNLLDQITRAIGERQDLQSIYQVAIRSLEERLPVDFSCVLRYDAADNALTVIRVGAHSQALAMELAMDEQSRVEIDRNGLSRCVRGELVYEEDIQEIAFPFPQRLARGGLRSLVVAPLQSESRVFGILVVARQLAQAFSSADCEFLRQLSAHVALAAQQAELHGSLQQAYDDLRQTQQTVMQQERLRALGQMASGIAHDINNALSPVALYTESLLEREPGLSERGRGYLVTIARAIDDVAATVARMREFYRQREPQLQPTPVRLNLLVQQVLELTHARWSDIPQQRGVVIHLETELAPDLPAILGVESEVREALINLVFNAVDAMPDGGVLTLHTRSIASPDGNGTVMAAAGRYAVVEVTDTGVGMDEDTRRRCLEPFFTTKGERGTGLGLAMVYGVTQRHGANVEIDSAIGCGTTVRLSFPVPTTLLPELAAFVQVEAPTRRLRILIVDDDPMMLKSLCDTLEADGHLVVTANGGQAGIDMFHAARRPDEAFDVVITDLGMPYVDGRKVASAVKARADATPVILLTGWGQRLVADGETPAHVDRVLSKPPRLREVRAALAQLTRNSGRAESDPSKETP